MRASELIKALQELVATHGNLQVSVFSDEFYRHEMLTPEGVGVVQHNTKAGMSGDDSALDKMFIGLAA